MCRESSTNPSIPALSSPEVKCAEIQYHKARMRDSRINNCENIKLKLISYSLYSNFIYNIAVCLTQFTSLSHVYAYV